MSSLNESLVINHERASTIVNIVNTIRMDKDYAKAAIILQDSGLTLFQLSCMTLRLSMFDIAKLGDELNKI